MKHLRHHLPDGLPKRPSVSDLSFSITRDEIEEVIYIRLAELNPDAKPRDLEVKARRAANMIWDWRYLFPETETAEDLVAAYCEKFNQGRRAKKELIAERIVKVHAEAGVPSEFISARLEHFDPSIRKYIQNSVGIDPGILIAGPQGVGKTYLAAAIVSYLAGPAVGDDDAWPSIVWHNIPELLLAIQATMGRPQNEARIEIYRPAKEADWLVLDDLGAEKASDWSWSTIYVLLNSRLESGRRSIVTTNLPLSEIDRGSGRIASRLKAFARLALVGRDRRDKAAEQGGNLFDGTNPRDDGEPAPREEGR